MTHPRKEETAEQIAYKIRADESWVTEKYYQNLEVVRDLFDWDKLESLIEQALEPYAEQKVKEAMEHTAKAHVELCKKHTNEPRNEALEEAAMLFDSPFSDWGMDTAKRIRALKSPERAGER